MDQESDTEKKSQFPLVATVKAEIVHGIPVRSPFGSHSNAYPNPADNPTAQNQSPNSIVEQAKTAEDKHFDQVLQNVNESIKKPDEQAGHKSHPSEEEQKEIRKKTQTKQANNSSSPIAATTAACLVAVILIVITLMYFKQGN